MRKGMFLLIAFAMGGLGYFGWQAAHVWISSSVIHFLLGCMVLGCSVLLVVTAIYLVSFSSFRSIILRFVNVLFKKR